MTISYDEAVKAYVGDAGFGFYDLKPATVEQLSRGFTLETDDGFFVTLLGAYAYFIAYACHNGTTFNIAAAGEVVNQLLSFKTTRYSSTTLRSMMPIDQYSPGTLRNLTFTKLYFTPSGNADGILHNVGINNKKGATYGFVSQLLVDPTYTPVITKMPAIVNSWPDNPKAQPAINKAIKWANDRRTTFGNPDMVRRYYFFRGNKITTSDNMPSKRRAGGVVEYPYIRVSAGAKGYLTLPFWCPFANVGGTAETGYPTIPFFMANGRSFNIIASSGEISHFEREYPFYELSTLSESAFNQLQDVLGFVRYPELVTEFTRRNGTSHGSTDLPNNIGTVVADGFKIKDEGEISWSHNAEERKRTLDGIREDSYTNKGMYTACAPEAIVGYSQWALLYGMCSAVGDWKRGMPLENLFLCGPRVGFFREEPLVYNARIMKFDSGQTFV